MSARSPRLASTGFFTVFFAFALLAGCVTPPPPNTSIQEPPLSKAARTRALTHLQNFEATGALAIRTPQEAFSLHWEWQQKRRDYTLTLRGPLGTGAVQLQGTPRDITLLKANGQRVSAKNPDQLLQRETGWALPVSGFTDWIRGLPVAGVPAQKIYDANNRLSVLKQRGWTVQYLQYQNHSGIDLPDKMTLTTPTLALKIVIRDWTVR